MTIFELLDRLETEIVSLRAQNKELRYSLYRVQANGASAGTADGKSASKKKKKAKPEKRAAHNTKNKKKSPAKKNVKQLPLPVVEGESMRALGKRQALGKSLLQLRRPQVARPT